MINSFISEDETMALSEALETLVELAERVDRDSSHLLAHSPLLTWPHMLIPMDPDGTDR